jgi:hypothetical protein
MWIKFFRNIQFGKPKLYKTAIIQRAGYQRMFDIFPYNKYLVIVGQEAGKNIQLTKCTFDLEATVACDVTSTKTSTVVNGLVGLD